MLTPIEIQGKVFKSGIGYDKKEVDQYLKQIASDYESVYKENVELNDKINVLSEGIQYYKTIEKTLQKALVLAEKTAEETQNAAEKKAEAIITDANTKAADIVLEAKKELDRIHLQTMNLTTQYDKFRVQFKQLAATQLEILNSDAFDLKVADLATFTPSETKEEIASVSDEPVVEEEPVKEEKAVEQPEKKEEVPVEDKEEVSDLVNHIELNPEVTNFDVPDKKDVKKAEDKSEYDMKEVTADSASNDFEFMDIDD